MGERCVVTGGAGVIGLELVSQLVAAGHDVRVVDLLPRPRGLPAAVDFVQGDIADLGADVVASFGPEVVYHLAAAFERSDEHPSFWHENAHHNVLVSAVVLDGATRSAALRRYVFASSYLIYDPELYLSAEPRAEAATLDERAPINPRNATGGAKLLHEKEIELASADPARPFSWVSARIFRVYGPSSRDVVGRWVRAGVAGEPITVYGDLSRFDYVYSGDVAEGLRRLAASEAVGVVNLATGRARTVREVVDVLRVHFPDLAVDGPGPAASYEGSQADLARLRNATGWAPQTSLERGIASLVTHERENSAAGTVSHRVRPARRLNVLVTSVSQKVPVVRAVRAAFRALNVTGTVWGGDVDETVVARHFVDAFWTMPRLDALNDSDLVDFCVANEIGLLIPTRDGELARLAELRPRLADGGVFVPIGTVESVVACDDKLEFARRCLASGLPAIPTAETIQRSFGERLVVKPRHGAGGRDAAIDVDARQATQIAKSLGAAVIQPFVPGDEYSIDTYVDRHGSSIGAVARRRVKVTGGESSITSVVDDDRLCRLAVDTTLALGVRGHAVVQAIRSDGGDDVLLECNSRVGGASNAAWASGLRTVDAMVVEALGEEPSPVAGGHSLLTMVRAACDSFRWP